MRQVVRLARCPQPSVTCTRVNGGAQLRCSSALPRRARRVRVRVAGAVGQSATGTARVRRGRYTVTLPATTPFAPGTYTYRHSATTTRRGERLVVVRSITIT